VAEDVRSRSIWQVEQPEYASSQKSPQE